MRQSLKHTARAFFGAMGLATALVEDSRAGDDAPAAAGKSVVGENSSLHSETNGTRAGAATDKGAHNSRVVFIVAKNCSRCDEELSRLQRPGGDFEVMRAGAWLIGDGPQNHVQIVDRDQVPELVKKLNPREYPVVAYIDQGEVV